MRYLLSLYDYLQTHKRWLWVGVVLLSALLLALALTLNYREDISDFLPGDKEYRESMEVYQKLSDASRIVVIFQGVSPDSLCDAIDSFADILEENAKTNSLLDPMQMQTEIDMQGYLERLRYVHTHAPYFLPDTSYSRLDSLFSEAGIRAALSRDRMLLSMPLSGLLQKAIASDPLSIFPLSAGASGQYAGASSSFSSYEGYMLTADHRMAFAFYDSPFGSMESSKNASLCDALIKISDQVTERYPGISVRLLGAPVVAVKNARCIKRDSLMVIVLAIVLIACLLFYAFPRKRDILLIGVSVSFGWLFGMAMLGLFAGEVSIIVLGIGSILLGIAVNYPLHLLVHQRYTTSVRQTLSEVLSPLVIGNITTVGAFMALIPLNASALRHLGIFASSMLFGTILFCVIVLPHLMRQEPVPVREVHLLPRRWRDGNMISSHPWITALIFVVVTLALSVPRMMRPDYELYDSNISHINYMTPEQRQDFAFFESLSPVSSDKAYLVVSAREELVARLNAWQQYWSAHNRDSVIACLHTEAEKQGFAPQAFLPFEQMLYTDFSLSEQEEYINEHLAELWPGRFDSAALNSRMANAMSDNFDYLSICCSLIVFVFLCLSFRSILLALVAFLPMALSWIWIFALMQIFSIHFNIVNVILATFIFGQGDDYTIFILEGLVYEYKTGKRMLPQYKQSIILSALIMLIGIGVLVMASHPAMHSLGTVTLVGMTSVVLMAYLVPPVLFSVLLKIPFFRKRILNS